MRGGGDGEALVRPAVTLTMSVRPMASVAVSAHLWRSYAVRVTASYRLTWRTARASPTTRPPSGSQQQAHVIA